MHASELYIDADSGTDVTRLIEEVAAELGLVATMRSTLKQYPGCTHWHFKRGKLRGVLEATYWPGENRAWLTYRAGRDADWIPAAIREFQRHFEQRTRARYSS
jgi:hypothetical protein